MSDISTQNSNGGHYYHILPYNYETLCNHMLIFRHTNTFSVYMLKLIRQILFGQIKFLEQQFFLTFSFTIFAAYGLYCTFILRNYVIRALAWNSLRATSVKKVPIDVCRWQIYPRAAARGAPGAYIQKFYGGGGQTPSKKNSFSTRNIPPPPPLPPNFNVFTRI